MKNLLIFALFIPFASQGQKFAISEQAGYVNTTSFIDRENQVHGFSNEVMVSYHPIKRITVSAFYEFNQCMDYSIEDSHGVMCMSHSFGISPDVNFKYFFAGLDLERVTFKTSKNGYLDYIKYAPTTGYGVHIGSRQRIWKRLLAIEQIGYDWVPVHLITNDVAHMPVLILYPIPNEVRKFYIRAGLSYKL